MHKRKEQGMSQEALAAEYEALYHYALSLCRNEALAQDITQDTFYIQAYYDMEHFYNMDEFGNSDEMYISTSIDTDNLDSPENYIFADYPYKTIKWNLKGEVIEEKLKEDYKETVTAE